MMLCAIIYSNSELREEERLMKGIGLLGSINNYVKKSL